jgi:hypothetical protein
MSLTVTVQTNRPVSAESAKRFNFLAVRDNGLLMYQVESSPWEAALDYLIGREQVGFIRSPSFVQTSKVSELLGEAVALILGADDGQPPMNDPEDCSPVLPGPCRGHVKDDIPLKITEKPTGHLNSIGDSLICSQALCRVFHEFNIGDPNQPVLYKEAPLHGWSRCRLQPTFSIIDPLCVGPTLECALCHQPYSPSVGVWVGQSNESEPLGLAMDEVGHSHFALRHPLIVSKPLAMTLNRLLKHKGYYLAPVYHPASRTGSTILAFLQYLQRKKNDS